MPCKILIRIKDKVRADHPAYNELFQKGDVICVIPPGWDPGRLELASDEVIWVDCPDMDQAEAEAHFMASESENGILLRRRVAGFDEALLPPGFRSRAAARRPIPTRQGQQERTYAEVNADFEAEGPAPNLPRNTLLDAHVAKTPLPPDPFVAGDDPFVAG